MILRVFKKIHILSFFALLLTLFGCSSVSLPTNDKVYLLSMNRMIHDCVTRIVGDEFQTIVLIDGPIDPHNYEMVKGDEDKIAMSRLIFCNGLGLEHTVSLRKHLECNPRAVKIGERLLARKAFCPLIENGCCDPHIWMDMSIWAEGVKEITQALICEFPDKKEVFLTNEEALLKEMYALNSWAEKCIASIPVESRYLVTGHDAFSYFARHYLATPEEVKANTWSCRCMSPEGTSPEAQISIRDIMTVVDYIHEHNVTVVFPEDTLNQDALKKIVSCLKKGHTLRVAKQPLYSDNVRDDYFSTFQHNVRTITEELGGTVF